VNAIADCVMARVEDGRNRAQAALVPTERERALLHLVAHMKLHDGYRQNGYWQMTSQQKALYDAIHYDEDGNVMLATEAAKEVDRG
jgi:hypothetical protein